MGETDQARPLRLFAAVELSDEARRAAAGHAARLRAAAQPGARVSWERAEKLHLTLKFFGNVEPARADALSGALARAAADSRPLKLALGGAGVFPSPSRPSVIWLGLSDESAELARLHERLEGECEAAGFPREQKPFRPHVTLARVRSATGETRALARLHLGLAFEPVNFEVSEIVLVSSQLGPGGSTHTPLSRHSLGGTARPEIL